MATVIETRTYVDGVRRMEADVRDDMMVTFRVWLDGEDQGANSRLCTVSAVVLRQLADLAEHVPNAATGMADDKSMRTSGVALPRRSGSAAVGSVSATTPAGGPGEAGPARAPATPQGKPPRGRPHTTGLIDGCMCWRCVWRRTGDAVTGKTP